MQLMLLKRQHRQLLQETYAAGVAQQQQQQQQRQSGGLRGPQQPASLDAAVPAAQEAVVAASPSPLPHMSADIEDVSIWDAFFDADLSDFQQYLAAGAAGTPTVFTTVNTRLQQQQHQHQQQPSRVAASSSGNSPPALELLPEQLEQLVEARRQLADASRLLKLLSPGLMSRPNFLSSSQLVQLGATAGRCHYVMHHIWWPPCHFSKHDSCPGTVPQHFLQGPTTLHCFGA
jgi:hypothetical protein